LRTAAYIGGLLGLAVLITLVLRADAAAMLLTLETAGWALLWLVPYRALYFLLYAIGWMLLLRPYDPQRRAGIGFLFWATTVREGIDRLLPVASVGGSVAGIRLLRWRGIAAAPAGASVIVEIVLTLSAAYLFTALGVVLLVRLSGGAHEYRRLLLALLLCLPMPTVTALLLRYGSVFARLERLLGPMVGVSALSDGAAALDHELRALLRRGGPLLAAGAMQCAAFCSGAFEIWFTLRLFGHPISAGPAIVLESMTQALRHLAFVVPAGLGVQEASLMLFGHAFGISGELALSVSMAKRVREVLCGLPALLSWHWMEVRRLRDPVRDPA
jgi:putative membrane protein